VKTVAQTAETQPGLLETKITDLSGTTLLAHGTEQRKNGGMESIADGGERVSVAAFNASV
jgi:hypothetical protein